MPLQTLPSEARSYARSQREEHRLAVVTVTAMWRTLDDNLNASFMRTLPDMLDVVNTAQARVTRNAQQYIPAVLEATGQREVLTPRFTFPGSTFVGTAGDGRPSESLLYNAVTTTKASVGRGQNLGLAMRHGEEFLALALGTLLSDTERAAEGLASYSRPVAGWVRMLNPPSCGRCVILAGKYFKYNDGFERHPRCDCKHIPAGENIAGSMTTNPGAYLDSLDANQLRKVLGSRANARAWSENGADLNQLVNAYRKRGGIRTAQLYDRTVRYTLEGTTRRGVAYHQMSRVRALSAQGEVKDGRYRRLIAPRLMPESIFKIATSRSHADKLLRDHGWLGFTP